MEPLHCGTSSQLIAIADRHQEIEELDAAIGKLSRTINTANYELMKLIREFDERAGWLKWSFTDAVHWLMWRCDLSKNAARDKLRIAHALKLLPLISSAFSCGRLSYSKVRALTRVATAENEAELIELAMKMSAAHVEQQCRRMKHAEAGSVKQAVRAYDARSLRTWRDESRGAMRITLEVPIEEGALFEKAIDKVAAGLSEDSALSCAADDKQASWAAMQADAAIAMARECLSGGSSLSTDVNAQSVRSYSADHYQVMVHVDEAALVKSTRQNNAEAPACSSELPIESVRRLCCDGSIVSVVESDTGEPLRIGRKTRVVTTAIRRALWTRDQGCAFPGCCHTRFVDAHHIKHWADGGETSVENMVLLCGQHHRMVHEGGYSIIKPAVGFENDGLVFKRPDGMAIPQCGYRIDDWLDDELSASENSAEVSFGFG